MNIEKLSSKEEKLKCQKLLVSGHCQALNLVVFQKKIILSDAFSFMDLIKLWHYFKGNLMTNLLMLQKTQKYLQQIHNLFVTNKLLLQLEALSSCDNFTVITILYKNDVLIWYYKDNNKYQVTIGYNQSNSSKENE